MIFSAHITTPTNTAATAPLVTEVPIMRGIIHKFEADFPPGNQHQHRVQILLSGGHILPNNPAGYLTTDGNVITYREHIEIADEPLLLTVKSWNLSDNNDHSVIIRVGILPKNVLTPWLLTWQERLAGQSLEDV